MLVRPQHRRSRGTFPGKLIGGQIRAGHGLGSSPDRALRNAVQKSVTLLTIFVTVAAPFHRAPAPCAGREEPTNSSGESSLAHSRMRLESGPTAGRSSPGPGSTEPALPGPAAINVMLGVPAFAVTYGEDAARMISIDVGITLDVAGLAAAECCRSSPPLQLGSAGRCSAVGRN